MDTVHFGAITFGDLAACGRRGLFYKKFLGVFRRSFSVGAAHWAARLVFCLLGCFAVPSCFSLPPGGRLFCRRKGAGGSVDTLYLVFRCRFVVAKSACLRFRLTAKTAPASLLLLSNANPLRWALRWGPPSAACITEVESLGLPLIGAPLLRRGSSTAQGNGEHGQRCVFLVGPDALIGPFSGGPVCRPYEGNRNLILHPARATARVAPTVL